MPRKRRAELIQVISKAQQFVARVTGFWQDGLPPELREEAHQLQTTLIETLDAEEGKNGPVVG